MATRRTFLQLAAASTAALVLPEWTPSLRAAVQPSPALTPFVDALPFPRVAHPTGVVPRSNKAGKIVPTALYQLTMMEFSRKLHRDLRPTRVWGYDASFPGPTFETRVGEPILVKWINRLPVTHLLPVDRFLDGADASVPQVRTVTHLHGGHVPPESDGGPEDWFPRGESATYYYPNNQEATTLWYHDHAMGITRLNVAAGLAGFYLLRDDAESSLNLPSGAQEVPLVIQDRLFNTSGEIVYPRSEFEGSLEHPGPWIPEYFGDTVMVNGKVWPYLEVEPRLYRFRVLNGSNARFYRLALSSGQPMFQIGSDGGLLDEPVQLNELLIAPGERADILVDFAGHAGETITVENDAPAPFPDGGDVDVPLIMQFRVVLPLSGASATIPSQLRATPIERLDPQQAAQTRDIAFFESVDGDDEPITMTLNGRTFGDPVEEKPTFGSVEVWRFLNTTGDAHPLHLHLVQFQVLGRQAFDVEAYLGSGALVANGPALLPEPNERGWKDTVQTNPGEITTIIARFGGYRGKYVYHCHILEHEDNQMMRPFEVV